MSNPQPKSQEPLTFEQKVLKNTLNKIEKLLGQLTEDVFTHNKVKALFEDLEHQLDKRNDITGGEKRIIKALLDSAKYFTTDIQDYVKYANEFFDDIKYGDLDVPYIKLKLEAIYIQMWGITEKIWGLEITYNTLCIKEHLCNEIQHNEVWNIYKIAEYVMYEIFTYLTNL
ncbi:MAG: hypothetical protein QXP36_04485 [Conexivisphaerales archaeon]